MKSNGFVVCITGPSGSGKTSLAEAVVFRFFRSCSISQDAFYRRDLQEGASFESPSSFDWEALRGEIERRRTTSGLVIVEGICLLCSPVSLGFDLVVTLACDVDVAMQRRLARDIDIGSSDPANSKEYFESVVWPAHEANQQHIEKNGVQVHLVLDATQSLASSVSRVEKMVQEQQKNS
jgi:uridine kinase